MLLHAAGSSPGSLFEAFFVQRHGETGELELLGTAIIWVLLALSVASIGLIIAIALRVTRRRICPAGPVETIALHLRTGAIDAAAESARREESDVAARLLAGIAERGGGREAVIRGIEQAADEHALRLLRRIEPIGIIGTVAPMLGLFGTVYGMIVAFREIVAAGGAPDPVGLAAGIGTALTTTFWGLVVAIPSLAASALLRGRVEALLLEATRRAEQLVVRTLDDDDPEPVEDGPVAEPARSGAR